MARVGIIGLGNVGRAVAKNVVNSSTYHLAAVYDRNPDQLSFLPSDVLRARHPKQLTQSTDITITALPEPDVVRYVMNGDYGVMAGLEGGKTWIDHSTTDYAQTMGLAADVEAKGAQPLEAPVTGGIALLKQGKMTVLVGGAKQTFENCKPLLRLSCENVLYMGRMGSATITKVVSNMLAGANTVLIGEALLMAKRSGVDLGSFFQGIRLSAGNSYVWETEAPLVFNGTFDPDFTIKLHCKDFGLGAAIAGHYNVPIPLMGLVEQIYRTARLRYGDDVGSSYPIKLQQEMAGESLQIGGFEEWTYTIEAVKGGSIGVVQSTKGE
jgi:3-hydroxyisobutyrate dehydrogenase